MEQCVNYLNYGSLIDNRNYRYEGGETKRLQSQRGEGRAQGELHCTKKSVKHGERSTKCEARRSERMRFFREVFKLGAKREN